MLAQSSLQTVASKSARALVTVGALFSIATGTVACNSDDAAVLGTIAVVAGAVAIGSSLDGDRDRDRDRDRHDRDRRDRDRRDRDHRPGGPGWGPGHGPGHGPGRPGRFAVGFELASTSPLALSTSSSAVNEVAAKYSLPLESAERLTAILQDGAAGKTTPLRALGLNNNEVTRVARYQMPSESALDAIAAKLAMSRTMARGLVQDLMDDTRAQMADSSSPAWTACQATGKWKTDANGGTCKSAAWTGCSVETGASMCASVQ